MLASARDGAGPLLGRDVEIALVTSLLDGLPRAGGALVLRGEPGIGKSRVLAEAVALARVREFMVLSAIGVQSEADLPFSGLHQLLRPVRAHAAGLLPAQRAALDAAFGLSDEDATGQRFRIAMAVLDLLAEAAATKPVLLVAEDAHWLDRPTLDVLAFVARRLESEPILMLAATRDGSGSAFDETGLPERRLGALEPAEAAALLDASAQDLPASQRDRLLAEAAGNPLALLELPLAITGHADQDTAMPGLRPLTERLERAFTARVSELPDDTRLLLLVVALHDGNRLDEVLVTGSAVSGRTLEIDGLEPAAAASIVEFDERKVRFRHPLMRSAVSQAASVARRQRVHAALAETLRADPDRRVWHRAALLTGEHEDVALELEEAGRRARRRGAISVAVAAMRRAAELSELGHRARRLLAAGELAFELGRRDVVASLLSDADELGLGPLDRARAMWIQEMVETRPLGGPEAAALLAGARQAGAEGERDLQIDLLWLVASRWWWVDPGPAARKVLIEAAHDLGGADAEDPRVFAIHAYADPFGHAPGVLARLRAAAMDRSPDTEAARHFGPASLVVGAFDLGADFLAVAADGLRAAGRLGHLPRVLMLYAGMVARLGDWDVARPAAAEAARLAVELREPQWEATAETVVSLIAGMRGDEEEAEQAAARAERIAEPAGANITVAFAQFGRVLAALGAGRHADAYAAAERLFDPADSAYHPVISAWLIGDLAEAALHADRIEEGRARVMSVETNVGDDPAIWIDLGLRHARAVLADDDEAAQRFEEALSADFARWPFQRARLLLAHGQWLRRRRRVADSRAPLRAARDGFDALGCAAWGDRARRELRASGESSRRRDPTARDQLTAQELQIAQLAAKGLSNREIGQQLYLSHRTVGTHLYRTFPKLGITARGELHTVLTPSRASPSHDSVRSPATHRRGG